MISVNDVLLDLQINHAVSLQKYSNAVIYKLISVLNKSDARLYEALIHALEQMEPSSFTMERLQMMLTSVNSINAAAYQQVGLELTDNLKQFAANEAAFQHQAIRSVLPVNFVTNTVNISQTVAAAVSRPFQGNLLKGFLSDLEASRAKKIRTTIAQGFVEGKTTSDIVKELRGTRARGFADGLLDGSRRDVETVARTALSHMAQFVMNATVKENVDLVRATQWLSTLDSRVTTLCLIRDGLQYTPVTHAPIGHSIPWLGGPGNLHFNALVGGTLINTQRGLMPIERVQSGDLVLTHAGRYKRVLALRSKVCDSGVIRVVRTEAGRILRATDDHPIQTVSSGWKFAGALKVGDQLFCNPESLAEIGNVHRFIDPEPEYGPAMSDDSEVALQRTLNLLASAINFEGNFEVGPCEIENSAAHYVLNNPERIKADQCLQHHFLALGQMLTEADCHRLSDVLFELLGLGNSFRSFGLSGISTASKFSGLNLFWDALHSGGVVIGHPFGVGGVNSRSFLTHSKRLVVLSGGAGDATSSQVDEDLCRLGSNDDIVVLSELGQAPIGKIVFPLNPPERQALLEMSNINKGSVVGNGFVHDAIVSLELQQCKAMVYDLEVEEDASYVANGIVVSNCRSHQTLILKSNEELGIPLPEIVMANGHRVSMDGAVPSATNYVDWITKQSASRQDEVLGVTRGKLLRDGKLSVADMFTKKGEFLSLEQLQAQDAAAFARAGL